MKKFTINPSVGMALGLLYNSSGKLPQKNTPEFIEINEKTTFLNPITTNLMFDLSLEYKIATNYGIYIKPFYKRNIKSIYQNYPLSGSYNTAGIKFGVNICL